jgi:hypothetical protein
MNFGVPGLKEKDRPLPSTIIFLSFIMTMPIMFLSSRVVWAKNCSEPPFWIFKSPAFYLLKCNLYPDFCLIISETQVFVIWFQHHILLHVEVQVGLDGIHLLSQARNINLNHPTEKVREEVS